MAQDVWQFRESMKFAAGSVDLSGYEVVGPDGSIGTIDKVSNDVRVNYVVVDAGDWLGGRQVILPAYTVTRVDPSARKVFIDRTRDDIRDAPEFSPEKRRTASFEDALTGYYHGMYDTGL
jgi:PRC-barrel domain protein